MNTDIVFGMIIGAIVMVGILIVVGFARNEFEIKPEEYITLEYLKKDCTYHSIIDTHVEKVPIKRFVYKRILRDIRSQHNTVRFTDLMKETYNDKE
jgi:hypothetical protein